MENRKLLFIDLTLILLLIANLVPIVILLTQDWDFYTYIWIYYFQITFIGFFKVIIVCSSKKILKDASSGDRFFIAYGLLGFYGVFLFFFYTSLIHNPPHLTDLDLIYLGLAVALFFGVHLFSTIYHRNYTYAQREFMVKHLIIRIGSMWFTLVILSGILEMIESGNFIYLVGGLLFKITVDVVTHHLEYKNAIVSYN
jgi:hypothetical protein